VHGGAARDALRRKAVATKAAKVLSKRLLCFGFMADSLSLGLLCPY